MRAKQSVPDERLGRTASDDRPSRWADVVGWVLQAALGVAIAGGGLAKLAADATMVALFADIGAGQWLRLVVGALEVAGGVGLLVPRLRIPASIGLLALLVCAAVTNVVVLQISPASPLAFAAVALAVLVLRRRELSGMRHPIRRRSVRVPAGRPDRRSKQMKYIVMTYASQRDYDAMAGQPTAQPSWAPEDFAAMGEFMEKFTAELVESGELIETRGLAAPAHTRRVRLEGGVPVVTDGPYAETQEVLAGYWVVDCADVDRATQIAARLADCPAPEHVRAAAVADVRPLDEFADAPQS